MNQRLSRVGLAMLIAAMISTVASGQGALTSLSGTVVDTSGAVVPGADVNAKSDATGVVYTAVTGPQGIFTIPSMNVGTYTVSVSLMGFKQAVVPGVALNAAVPGTVKVTMEVGALSETVVVQGGSDIVQTESATIAATLRGEQIQKLPMVSRDVMWGALTTLPGFNTTGGPRGSTVAGLPASSLNITLDGVNVQDNMLHNDFFSLISPRLDAIEEVTVTTAANSADAAGQGAVQIRMVTRSGTNQFNGSGYYYARHPDLNSNYWFTNRDVPPDAATGKSPKAQTKLYQPGFRVGGPIVLPRLFDGHDKAFFFFNFEQFRQPTQISRTRTVMSDLARQGVFRYTTSSGVQTRNVLQLAADAGQIGTVDPVIATLLADIAAATQTTGGLQPASDPNLLTYTFANDAKQLRYYPTWRIDYNVSDQHRASYTTWYQSYDSLPDTLNNADPRFPGFPNLGGQGSKRLNWSAAMRSTLTSTLVNEARVGYTASTVNFFTENTVAQFQGTPVADQAGLNLDIGAAGVTSATSSNSPQRRTNPTVEIQNTLNWTRGSHTFGMGGSFTHVGLWAVNWNAVPTIGFGMASGDPAQPLFVAANFPGASTAQVTAAQNLYAVLTGRVTSIGANARLDENTGKYVYNGVATQRGQLREVGLFVQDNWRMRRDLTFNYGLRYELQFPFTSRNNSYSTATIEDVWGMSGVGNLFTLGGSGKAPVFVNMSTDTRAYNTDWNNLAPTVGFAWRPTAERGPFRRLLGQDGDTVLRAGYSIAFLRRGMSRFTDVLNSNPGVNISATRNAARGNLVLDGAGLPVLLRQTGRLGAPPFQEAPAYPLTGAVSDSVNIFDPNLKVPYAQSWSAGVQRALTRNTAVEVRYVGTRQLHEWTTFNFNGEANIVSNGFLDEFKRAQANLQANIAAQRGNTFAYFGPGTGTSPLPTYLAYLNGRSDATNAAAYTGGAWSNTNWTNPLARFSPNPFTPAGTGANNGLDGDATRRDNARRAGLPANFFRVNPALQGGASMTGNGGWTRYNALQIELRRRLANGFHLGSSYVYAKGKQSQRISFRAPLQPQLQDTLAHTFKADWVFELPFGQGRRFGSNVGGFLDRIIGGWEFDGNARLQSGNVLNFGNVRLIGMTDEELQKAFKVYERIDPATGRQLLFALPEDIILNTIKAFSTTLTGHSQGAPEGRYFAPANGPDCIQVVAGDCAPRHHYVTGPAFYRVDLSIVKRVKLAGRANIEVRGEFLNALNNINFLGTTAGGAANTPPVVPLGSSQTILQVTSAYRDVNNTQDPGGRLGQLVFRINW